MASWMIHLRVADLLMDRIPWLDATAFVMGNIAPDSGVPNADWTAYSPPKAVSHYKTRRNDEAFFDIERFISGHFTSEQIWAYSRREFSFFLGYYVHLLTDAGWALDIYRPAAAEHVEKRGEDKQTFIREMKRDWYDLDFRYLEEHPGFRAFRIYEQASGFTNDFMDIFSKDAFDNRREYICGFYRGRRGELYREYPFLNPAQADAFVERTAEAVFSRLEEALAVRNRECLNQSVRQMADRISGILSGGIHSIWLYGSVVFDDFRPGWSDIDLLVLSDGPMTGHHQAQQLAGLRQAMTETEPDDPYYRSFEGIIADKNEYLAGTFSRLVYWGTSGQRITDRYQPDAFAAYELAKYGRSLRGSDDRSIFAEPSAAELRTAVRQHYESIRKYAVQTDGRIYSCGWLLDIARCIYTLRHHDVAAKTQAGLWALAEHIFEDEEPLKKALEIRRNPVAYQDREDVRQWLKGLGPVVQQYADVLQQELYREDNLARSPFAPPL